MLDLRDPDSIAKRLKRWDFFLRRVFRCEVSGMENVGSGPHLLVANHNIGAAFEIMGLLKAWEEHHDRKRPIYGLTHPFMFKFKRDEIPMRRIGGVPATYEDAYRVLDAGHSLLVFPGGNAETIRPFWQRNRTDFGGRKGWAKIALSRKVPIIPVSITGSHSVNPVFVRSRLLATVLVVPRLFGIKYFPISLSQIVYPGALGLAVSLIAPPWVVGLAAYVAFMSTPLWPIFPAKIRIKLGKAVVPNSSDSADLVYDVITKRIQAGMNA